MEISKKTIIILVFILAIAGALRTIRAFEQQRYDPDAYGYFTMAANWSLAGTGYAYSLDASTPPLLPWAMSKGQIIGLSPERTGLILGGALGTFLPIAVFVIAFLTLGRKENFALIAAFFATIHPFLIRISVSCMRECLYIPLVAFAIMFAILAINKKSFTYWVLFACTAALGVTARREGIVLIVIFLFWLAVEAIIDFKKFFKAIKYYATISVLVLFVYFGFALSVQYTLRKTQSTWSFVNNLFSISDFIDTTDKH